jgi:hypothetical protein
MPERKRASVRPKVAGMARLIVTTLSVALVVSATGTAATGQANAPTADHQRVERLARHFALDYLRLRGGDGCHAMIDELRRAFVAATNEWLNELGAGPVDGCPQAFRLVASINQGLVGPDRTRQQDRRARARRHARIHRLHHGEGVGTVTVDADVASVAHVTAIGPLTAQATEGDWQVSDFGGYLEEP